MKKTGLICIYSLFALLINAQTLEKKWNLGLHGGFGQYKGDLGNDFYRLNMPAYCHAGFSISRFLSPHFDATLLMTRGDLGHFAGKGQGTGDTRTNFRARMNTFNLLIKYNFLNPAFIVRPYVFAGAGLIMQNGFGSDNVSRNLVDYSLPSFGGGLNIRLSPVIDLQLQEMFMNTSSDDIDFTQGGMNDFYLFHTLGLTFNFGLNRRGQRNGVGDRIDQCPKVISGSQKGKKAARAENESKNLSKAGKRK